jgi:hypothetical protein
LLQGFVVWQSYKFCGTFFALRLSFKMELTPTQTQPSHLFTQKTSLIPLFQHPERLVGHDKAVGDGFGRDG